MSIDGDTTFKPVLSEFTSGDLGPIDPDTSYHIVWDGLQSHPNTYDPQTRIKLVASLCPEQRISDVDGNTYFTVGIGTQCWMKVNLKTTKYSNGISIEYPDDDTTAWQISTGAYAWYSNDSSWKNFYGALYNWEAVNNTNPLCPVGWHVPSDSEWTTLTDFLGGVTIAGGKLKSTRTEPDPQPRWKLPNFGADNISNYSGLPGGSRTTAGTFIGDIGIAGKWWSSSEQSSTDAWMRRLNYGLETAQISSNDKQNGYSVRCIRD